MRAWLTRAGTVRVEKRPCPAPGERIDRSRPRTGVVHTTEGNWESALGEFEQHFAPHFLLGRDQTGTCRIAQLIPLGQMAASLLNPAGGVETNRWAVAQIEVVGMSSTIPWLPADDVQHALASLMLTLQHEAGIPLSRPFEDAMPPLPWATTSFSRRHAGKWGEVPGWYGHVEVPENDHWDPGALRWSELLGRSADLASPAREDYLQIVSGKRGEMALVDERKVSQGGLEAWLDSHALVRKVQADDRVVIRIREHA
jgi:N-acetylmuramoyl-L-alanine amidase